MSIHSPDDIFASGIVTPRRFLTREYHQLIEAGVLGEDDHVELLEGIIVSMTPQRRTHARVISALNAQLVPALGNEYRVRVQLPLSLNDLTEPEPDVAVVTKAEEDRAVDHPTSALLVIEVGESSVKSDRDVKGRIYAKANIPEYWIVNVRKRTLEVLTSPSVDEGRYQDVSTLVEGATVQFGATVAIALDTLFA